MKKCSLCGTIEYDSTALKCSKCNGKLIVVSESGGQFCINCGQAIAVNNKFCPQCGKRQDRDEIESKYSKKNTDHTALKLLLTFFVIFGFFVLGILYYTNTKFAVHDEEKSSGTDAPPLQQQEVESADANSYQYEQKPFYGVWCGAFKSQSNAEKAAHKLAQMGFEPLVFISSDWENLNPEHFYILTADICETKQDAIQLLNLVKSCGYPNAYIKYTGKRRY